jgi:hypothetical protein
VARIRAQTVYMLACGQCGDGTGSMLFGSLAARIAWMRDHAGATGHDGYLVQDIERLVAEDRCPLCNEHLTPEGDGAVGRDAGGQPWPSRRCEEHGAWGLRDDGRLVPVSDF